MDKTRDVAEKAEEVNKCAKHLCGKAAANKGAQVEGKCGHKEVEDEGKKTEKEETGEK